MNDNASFNITSVWEVLTRRWKIITAFVAVTLILTAIMLMFFVPRYYKSQAVIIASNPALADKARLLNNNIQQLYSPFGSSDDLNRLYAIAHLDTLHYQLVHEFDLVKYYHEDNKASAAKRAVKALEDDLELVKTENDELHIILYTKDKNLSAKIVNRLVELIDTTAARAWRGEYTKSLTALEQSITSLKVQLNNSGDSSQLSSITTAEANKQALASQLKQFETVANEYRLAINNSPSALVVLEHAFPSLTYDKPKVRQVLFAALVASLAFAVMAVLIYDKNKTP
jgi:capsular polysaccharide biosynthesis protein